MKVIFHKLFPYAPYLNEYIGAEMDFPDTKEQDVFDGYVDKLREMAESNHKKKYPHIYAESSQPIEGQPAVVQVEKPTEDQRIGVLVTDINSCTELKVLESYRILAKTKPELQAAYDKKKKELVAKESREIIEATENLTEERNELLRQSRGDKSKS